MKVFRMMLWVVLSALYSSLVAPVAAATNGPAVSVYGGTAGNAQARVTAPGSLPFTGLDLWALSAVGVLMLVGGWLFYCWVGRIR